MAWSGKARSCSPVGGAWDGLLDWTAVTLGALTAAAVWQHRRRLAAGAIGAIVTVLAAGIRRRK